jgi:hypothetical protein
MTNETRNYVAVLPDGTEHAFELSSYGRDRGFNKHDFESKIGDILSRAGLKTPRKEPQAVKVKCFRLSIKGKDLERTPAGNYEVTPPRERMTEAEFNEEQADLLKRAPEEFHSALSHKAWEDGHSSGYEEVILVLDNLIDWLEAPLKAYTDRIHPKKKKS